MKPKGARLNGFAVTQGDVNNLLLAQRQLIWANIPAAIWIEDRYIAIECVGMPNEYASSVHDFRMLIRGCLWTAKAVRR